MGSVHITPPPLSSESMADLLCTIMMLARGEKNGKHFWAYVCIKPSMAQAFKEAHDAGAFNLEDFGTVIEWGEGGDPPPETVSRMERDYGMNHNYENELIAAIDAQKRLYAS